MADFGVNLVLQARTLQGLEHIKNSISQSKVKITCCPVEFESQQALQEHCDWIKCDCPDLDFAFLNAGMSLQPREGSFTNGNTTGWTRTYQVNVIAPWQITKALLAGSTIKERGKVLFVSSSISGRLDESGYACSKAALNKLAGDLSSTYQQRDVDFCLIDPGWIATDMGGHNARHSCSSLLPGILLPVVTPNSCNGSWISVQDYAGFSIEEALKRAYHTGDLKEEN
jgi:short-subunit dehydrogenase